jgi:hypothetical protein
MVPLREWNRESSTRPRPVVRAVIDLAGGRVSYDPWAVDDYDGPRCVLDARHRTLLGGRSIRWSLEKRGAELVGCTRTVATLEEIVLAYGAEAATRFFEAGCTEAEIVVEVPIPVHDELFLVAIRASKGAGTLAS